MPRKSNKRSKKKKDNEKKNKNTKDQIKKTKAHNYDWLFKKT